MRYSLKTGMIEATRLTRAGRLIEAMAAIRRSLAGGAAAPSESEPRTEPTPQADEARSDSPVRPAAHPVAGALPQAGRFEERSYANAAGRRSYRLYIPSSYRGQALPLVVMLHGCTQSPEDFAAGTRMNELAEELGFFVVFPRQTRAANASKCWNWFSAADQQRDRGEPSLIAGITGRSWPMSRSSRAASLSRASPQAVPRRRSWAPPIRISMPPSASIRGWPAGPPATSRPLSPP